MDDNSSNDLKQTQLRDFFLKPSQKFSNSKPFRKSIEPKLSRKKKPSETFYNNCLEAQLTKITSVSKQPEVTKEKKVIPSDESDGVDLVVSNYEDEISDENDELEKTFAICASVSCKNEVSAHLQLSINKIENSS